MLMNVFITFTKLAITCTIMLAACLQAQDRGSTSLGEVRMQVGDVFSRAHLSGSLEYSSACYFKSTYPDFPNLQAVPDHNGPAVELLREMFSVDPEMRVSQNADGRVRVIETDVPSDLLDVKIHRLRFPPDYHGPNMAIIAILKTPEVIAFRREHNIGPEADWRSGGSYPSDAFAPDKPSVHGVLYEVTVREALDYVLRTFQGFWFYENCKDFGIGRRVVMGFIENMPDAVLVQTKK
jgi:hypothetical protein